LAILYSLIDFVVYSATLDVAKNPCLRHAEGVHQLDIQRDIQSTENPITHCITLYAYIMYWRNRWGIEGRPTLCSALRSALRNRIATNPQLHNWTMQYTTTIR